MSSIFDRLLVGSLLIVAVTMVGLSARAKFRDARPDRHSSAYEIGETFRELSNASLRPSDSTVLVWVRSGCSFCTASMPFYRALVTKSASTRVVVVGHEPVDILRKYVAEHGFVPHEVVSVGPHDGGRITATPTLVLLDRELAVRGFWVGKLASGVESKILGLVR